MYFDAHSHLADARILSQVPDIIARAKRDGVNRFLQGGVSPTDWETQAQLSSRFPEVFPCFGLHPYSVSALPPQDCDTALSILKNRLPNSFALGECGLDYREIYVKQQGRSHQVAYFVKQLELAHKSQKPVILHIVRAHKEAVEILRDFRGLRGFIHAFNSDSKTASLYLSLGFSLSVGGALLNPNNEKLKSAVREIPLEKLFLESDTPDQLPMGLNWPNSEPRLVPLVAAEVARLKGTSINTVQDTILENGKKVFPQVFSKDL